MHHAYNVKLIEYLVSVLLRMYESQSYLFVGGRIVKFSSELFT
jgi:hypothetical protein